VRVKGIGDAGGEIVARHRRAQPRHVEIGRLGIAAELGEQVLDQLLRALVVNERGLEPRQAGDAFLDRQRLIDVAGVVRGEFVLDHRRRVSAERCRGRARAIDEDGAGIETGAALVIVEIRLEKNVRHRRNPRSDRRSATSRDPFQRSVPGMVPR